MLLHYFAVFVSFHHISMFCVVIVVACVLFHTHPEFAINNITYVIFILSHTMQKQWIFFLWSFFGDYSMWLFCFSRDLWFNPVQMTDFTVDVFCVLCLGPYDFGWNTNVPHKPKRTKEFNIVTRLHCYDLIKVK